MNKVPIIVNGNINPIFVKANSFLLKKYNISDYNTLKSLWYQEFEGILNGQDNLEYICFDNPRKQIIFSIKFE